ncbi:MAG: lipopolysaccharide kinase InaA family protein, partial [Planctomycetota bacterium]
MSEAPSTEPGETRRAIGGELWRGTAAALDELTAALADSDGAVTVKENRRRSVKRYALPGGGHVFVKRFRDAGLGQTVKAMTLGSRAWREIKWSRELAAGGVATAEPLAWAESSGGKAATGAVAHRGVEGGTEAIEVVHDPAVDPARRQRLLHDIAAVLRKAHDLGIGFRDFHLGNVLVTPHDGLVLIDLQSAWRPGPLLGRIRLVNLAMALTSIPRRAWPQARRALRSYGPVAGMSEREVARWAAERATKMIRRHFRSRSERCLRDSTEFVVENRGGWRMFRRRDADGARVAELPSQALEAVERKSPGVLKDSRESAVVRGLDLHGTPV